MGTAIGISLLVAIIFYAGTKHAQNRIIFNLKEKGYPAKDIVEVVKIWT